MKRFLLVLMLLTAQLTFSSVKAQNSQLLGIVTSQGKPVSAASLILHPLSRGTFTTADGSFILDNVPAGSYSLEISATGYLSQKLSVTLVAGETKMEQISLEIADQQLQEIVVTGTLKPVRRIDSPVPVEIISPQLFQKNPAPSLFESIGMVNGVRPQINCNVCNTGSIQINGMQGPYTMILIDGMPIVSSLSSVYGLNGIPNSMIDHIEIVKGPASSLYGSEAMGGIINVITKNPEKAPAFSMDMMATSWQELNLDLSTKLTIQKTISLLGVNIFHFDKAIDKNRDGFTDATLQKRVSVFNKWNIQRPQLRLFSLGGRYVYEDRWGGELNWKRKWRGSDTIYGESIYTQRLELVSLYQLPVQEKIILQASYNFHQQNSFYGNTPYMAKQHIGFVQLYHDKQWGKRHSFLSGLSYRYTWYDDNTPGTRSGNGLFNTPACNSLPGLFLQDEYKLTETQTLLAGYRLDYDKNHGIVHSPRIAYKWSFHRNHTLRMSLGTGYRVVNLFTEDHAALSGSREVLITEELNPERSYNSNLNYTTRIQTGIGVINFDLTGFYTYFTNKIVGDFDADPDKIIYDNLDGHAISRGVSLNTDIGFFIPLKMAVGASYMDVYQREKNSGGHLERVQQLHAPKWSGTFSVTYTFPQKWVIDLTGQWNGPMRLPVLPNDYRPAFSPWYCIANVQFTKQWTSGLEMYGGLKNLFNFIPAHPIMRPFDPFDRYTDDPVENPYGYTFDPSYNYAPLQGIRGFLGIRWQLLKKTKR